LAFHAAITTSLTICKRIILLLLSSKWQLTASFTITFNASIVSASVKIDTPKPLAINPPSGLSSTIKIISSIKINLVTNLPVIFYYINSIAIVGSWFNEEVEGSWLMVHG